MTAPLPLADIPESHIQLRSIRSRSNELVLASLVGVLLLAILAFGAVETWAKSLLEISVAGIALFWTLRQIRRGTIAVTASPIFLPMAAFGLLILLQASTGISSYRHATVAAVMLYAAYACTCFLITQTLTRTTEVRVVATA